MKHHWCGLTVLAVGIPSHAAPTVHQKSFCTPGRPLEITLPEGEVHPLKAAFGQHEPYAGGGMSWLRFRRGGYSYIVYGGAGRWGAKDETVVKQGVAVETNGKTTG